MSQLQIGCSYNPNFMAGTLSPPEDVTWIELGIAQFLNWRRHNIENVDLSLHIARSPITEKHSNQNSFISYIQELLQTEKKEADKIKSIGFHLSGKRMEGIGHLGLTSHFTPNKQNVSRAIAFIEKAREVCKKDIWIENANFYSGSFYEIVDMYGCVSDICKTSDCGLIVDLSHIFIDLHNAGADPTCILWMIQWEYVKEIHISGIIKGRDGIYHDGHSQSVSDEIWCLLNQILYLLQGKKISPIITIEHSDYVWGNKQDEYFNDFELMKKYISSVFEEFIEIQMVIDSEYYARRHICKNIMTKYEPLISFMNKMEIDVFKEVTQWIDKFTEKGKRLTLDINEIVPKDRNTVVTLNDFISFIEGRYVVRN